MKLPPNAPDGSAWNERALISIGVYKLTDYPDGPEIEPDDVDMTKYDAAAASDDKAALIVYADAKQWGLAIGGYTKTLEGVDLLFATDPTSQGLITGKALRLTQPNAPVSIDWQFDDGFVTISSTDFLLIAVEISDFVQATFATLKKVLAEIEAGSISTKAAVDSAAWPSNKG